MGSSTKVHRYQKIQFCTRKFLFSHKHLFSNRLNSVGQGGQRLFTFWEVRLRFPIHNLNLAIIDVMREDSVPPKITLDISLRPKQG